MKTRPKVGCISSRHEADAAVARGADDVGFVAEVPSGPGVVADATIADVAAAAAAARVVLAHEPRRRRRRRDGSPN